MPAGLWLTGIVSVVGSLGELTIAIVAAIVIARRVSLPAVRIAMWLAVGLLVLAEVISRCVPPLIAALAAVPLAGSSTLETTTVVHAVSGLIAAVPAAGSIVCYAVAAGRLAGTGRLAGPVRDFFHSSRPPKPGIDGGTPGRPTTGPAEGIDS